MKSMYVQHFMPNSAVREISIGRRKKLHPVGTDDDCEFAVSGRSAIVLLGVENYDDLDTRVLLHLTNELLDRLTETGKELRLHISPDGQLPIVDKAIV